MNQSKAYLYVRYNEYLTLMYGGCKMGITKNIPDRDSTYITSEVKPGNWELVFEIPFEDKEVIEKLLQLEFQEYHIYHPSGATEVYNNKIIDLVECRLIEYGVEYKKLNKEEISDLNRTKREKKSLNKNKQELINMLKFRKTNNHIVPYIPRDDQTVIIGKSVIHFQKYDKGILVLMCGVGKTLISLWITQKLNSNTILIGVPNRLLLKQWEEVIRIMFQNVPYLLIEGGVDSETIKLFLSSNQDNCIVITTYASSHKLYTVTKDLEYKFDMKINDEAHHLTSININEEEKKTYVNMLKIDSKKQLSLTATLKILENKETQKDEDIIISNDNIDYFGDIIDRKGLLWAINKNIICDYVIQTIVTDEEQLCQQLSRFHIKEENDKRLFLSAFASLKSVFDGHSHHLLIYANNKDNSLKIIQYIEKLLEDNYFDIPNSDLYYSNYHSEMKSKDQKEIINSFEKAKFGIITCVYCLGEGWDFPLLDGVVFSENMTSNIRIVQSTLRASRKSKKDINKKTKIILPILNKDEWLENNENPDLKKVREVIYQLGLEDETISQKIKVSKIIIEQQKLKPKEERETVDEFGDYDNELTRKLKLKTVQRIAIATTYEKAKRIIADKNIKNKESYYELCERDNRLPKEPEIVFRSQFTSWIEYLSIKRVYYSLETCKNKINEYLLKYPHIKKHYLDLSIISSELCNLDKVFPPNGLWVEYYNVNDLRDIINLDNKKKKRSSDII